MRYRFGEKLREVRERRGWTLKAVAEAAGVSESLVSQIERNRVSPAIDTLLTLADVLEIDLEYLFADFKKERAVKIGKAAARQRTSRPGVLYEHLARVGAEADHGMEAYLITIDPGARTGRGEYGHPGFEMGYVAAGSAELAVGTKSHRLEQGDAASFQADVPHTVTNIGTTPLTLFWVVTPPRGDI